MKLTTVIASVNNNPDYYRFISKQIRFWQRHGVRFLAVFVGETIPDELKPYAANIVLWNTDLDLNHIYVAQNIRMYYASLLDLPDDELVMITDMDMLPLRGEYFTGGLEGFEKRDFIHYRTIPYAEKQIYMCYNAAHPSTWATVFNIHSAADISTRMRDFYQAHYTGVPGDRGWYIDQEVMYQYVIPYPYLKELKRDLKRMETWVFDYHIQQGHGNEKFALLYDDGHFHRSFSLNAHRIQHVEKQLI